MKLDENVYSEAESDEDSLGENLPAQHLSEYPEPFRGTEEENIYEFIKELDFAFYYNKVRASDRVDILKRLVKGNAEYSVSEYKSLDENLEWLKKVFGNPHAIWEKEKEKFLRKSREEVGNWTDYFSPQRKLMLVKILNFLKYAEGLAKKFEILQPDVFSNQTLNSLMVVLPPKIIHKIIKKKRKEGGEGVTNTFKYMKEVVEDEIETEIVASRYYDAYAESYRIHDGQVREDENLKAVARSRKGSEEYSSTKTVKENEVKNPKKLALRNLKRHFQRISRSVKANKSPDRMINNFLKKSKQVIRKFKNNLSNREMSGIQKKMDEVKIANHKMKAEAENLHFQFQVKEFVPKKSQKTKTFMLDDYIEQDQDELKLPDVPSGTPEHDKSEVGKLDTKPNPFEDIESRLTKLKFFNKTWLKNEHVSKIHPVKSGQNVPKVSSNAQENAIVENEKEVPIVDSIKEEIADEPVTIEPVFSTKEEIDAFNDWYYKKIAENKIRKRSKPISISPKTGIEVMESSCVKQVVTKTTSSVWKVDMDVVIVLLVALVSLLPKYLFRKHFPVPVTASTLINPASFPVSGFETVFSAVCGNNADQSAESCTTEINLRDSVRQALPGTVWRKKCGEYKKFELKV